MGDLALDDVPLVGAGSVGAQRHQVQRGDNRRQRIAQLMAEHREEFVLRAVRAAGLAQRRLRLAIDAGVVERQRHALRQLRDQRAIVGAEVPVRFRLQRGQRTQRPPARGERNDEMRAHPNRFGEAQQIAVTYLVVCQGRIEARQVRLAGGDGPRHRTGRFDRCTQPVDQLHSVPRFLRIGMMGERALQVAIDVQQVDPAPVGDRRHHDRCDRLQRRLRFERTR